MPRVNARELHTVTLHYIRVNLTFRFAQRSDPYGRTRVVLVRVYVAHAGTYLYRFVLKYYDDNKMQTLDRVERAKERAGGEEEDERCRRMPTFDNLIYTPWTRSLLRHADVPS